MYRFIDNRNTARLIQLPRDPHRPPVEVISPYRIPRPFGSSILANNDLPCFASYTPRAASQIQPSCGNSWLDNYTGPPIIFFTAVSAAQEQKFRQLLWLAEGDQDVGAAQGRDPDQAGIDRRVTKDDDEWA